MEIFGISIILLSIILGYQAWKNGQWMKQAHRDTLEMLHGVEKGREEMGKEMVKARMEMAEAIKTLGNLIVSEGEKTRQAIKSSP